MEKITKLFTVDTVDKLSLLAGSFDENINTIMKHTDTEIYIEGTSFNVSGQKQNVERAIAVLDNLSATANMGIAIDKARLIV